jgi:hypothetical protein
LFVDLSPEEVVQRLQEGTSPSAPPNPDDEVVDANYRVLDDD